MATRIGIYGNTGWKPRLGGSYEEWVKAVELWTTFTHEAIPGAPNTRYGIL